MPPQFCQSDTRLDSSVTDLPSEGDRREKI